ncbi:MAG: hypothetical protein ABGZ35_11650 [Planctomycetaceae bacterium]
MKFCAQPRSAGLVVGCCFVLATLFQSPVSAQVPRYDLPMKVAAFEQQVHVAYTVADGLPSDRVQELGFDSQGELLARTPAGAARIVDETWQAHPRWPQGRDEAMRSIRSNAALIAMGIDADEIRDFARHKEETAVATAEGLFVGDMTTWQLVLPRQGAIRWAPLDIKAVAWDRHGQLWFACPQGVGYRVTEKRWQLFTGAEGLPYNDFTCMTAGPKGVWFGTTNGAIRFIDGDFEFRQGRRWLVDNHVNDIAIDTDGSAWIATPGGVSHIQYQPTTLAEKADWFETEIDRYHRRTDFGYVNPARMSSPGQKESAVPQATDNDGHFTGLYLGAASFGYAATKSPRLRQNAIDAFKSLNFLSTVTEGGSHPAPKGFICRAIEPKDGPDPNLRDNAAGDRQRRAERDALWKIIDPRWPVDETGEWYWKCDASSDELDGYYFGYGIYYDHVCHTEQEKAEVREIVRTITDHLIEHDFTMVDHDGLPTRWGHFSPKDMNQNPAWWVERGLNSYSILTYLNVAYHITGDQKYRDVFLDLAIEHGFGMNGMTQPKVESGPGSFGQADDNMAFMNYYHLIRYETDPQLLSMFHNAIYYHWRVEKQERNPFFNFVYAACCLDRVRKDQWRELDLSPPKPWLEESVDTLKRYPMDLIDWPMSNAHRIDMIPLAEYTRGPEGGNKGKGHRVDGHVFRIDEQHAIYWGDDPWHLTNHKDGTRLREGVSYLLAYYMGLAHGYISEPSD